MLIQVTTGKEIFETATAKVQVFFTGHNGVAKEKEIPLYMASKDGRYPIQEARKGTRIDAGENYRSELGSWTKDTVYTVTEGTLIKVFSQSSAQWSRANIRACQFILMRENAAYRKIHCRLTQHEDALIHWADIEGKFDLLSVKQAEEAFTGLNVRESFARFHKDPWTSRAMEFETVAEETKPRDIIIQKEIEVSEGKKLVIRSRKRRRALDPNA